MAAERRPLAYFKCLGNPKVITPFFHSVDVTEMRRHPEYAECDAEGNEVKSPPVPEIVHAPRVEAFVPPPKPKKPAKVTV